MYRNEKIPYTEYLLKQLHKWYLEEANSDRNDLSVLKVLKLTFFISAINTKPEEQDTLLDMVFDNYVAMPFGPVESDVYDLLKSNDIPNVSVDNNSTTITVITEETASLDPVLKGKIDTSINDLKVTNRKLILKSAFYLVDLSHKWYSWQKNFQLAKTKGLLSQSIPVKDIKSDVKLFKL